ncbi:cytosine deaminase [Breoghania sp. L-A4]|uniref:cytosine deaminase n=1 Tax=Breoghania sp. L-A4 TaxID=2304600 RepID=UPI0020C0CA2F|nr:cytosine deaminase [Breoghania sp. L-A4]
MRRATLPAALVSGVTQDIAAAEGLMRADVLIDDGRMAAIQASGIAAPDDLPFVDLDGGLVLPTLVDCHTHLDKGHIWPRRSNPDGTFPSALAAVGADRIANWSAEDVRARMEFALRCAFAHGTSAIRTHIDSIPPQDAISWPVLEELRAEWAGRVEVQGACLFAIDQLDADDGFLDSIADRVAAAGGVLGAVTYMVPRLDEHLDALFSAATERGLDLDFHVDETADPDAESLKHIAEAAIRSGFDGTILCGHCCSISNQPEARADATLDLVARAGVHVVSLPMCNMYLQGRASGRTPRWRGITMLHEMKARGIPVMVASDNTRDPFYAYGDLDLVEVYTQATRIAQLDHPVGDWITTVSTAPADVMRLPAHGRLSVGGPADMILFRARDWSELLSRPAGPREVLRSGLAIDRTLPDYRELDALLGVSP